MLMDPERVLALRGAASRAGGEAVRRAPGADADPEGRVPVLYPHP